jgi:hypothetical protein
VLLFARSDAVLMLLLGCAAAELISCWSWRCVDAAFDLELS